MYGDCRTRVAWAAWEGLVLFISPGVSRFGVLMGRCNEPDAGADGMRFGALRSSSDGA